MNDLREVKEEPEFLTREGFIRHDEETTDSVRWVRYEKTIQSDESQIRFDVQVEFQLTLFDTLFTSYTDNRCYSFNGVNIKVIDRQMNKLGNKLYDEETERPREIDRWRTRIYTMEQVRLLLNLLNHEIV